MERKKKTKAGAFDFYIGQQIRKARSQPFRSQEKLAEAIGITFQQVQKYELGKNRVSTTTLCLIARFFGLPVSYFLPDEFKSHDANMIGDLKAEIFHLRNKIGAINEMSQQPAKY